MKCDCMPLAVIVAFSTGWSAGGRRFTTASMPSSWMRVWWSITTCVLSVGAAFVSDSEFERAWLTNCLPNEGSYGFLILRWLRLGVPSECIRIGRGLAQLLLKLSFCLSNFSWLCA